MVEVGAGVEQELVGNDRRAALAGRRGRARQREQCPSSASVSLASTSTVSARFSVVEPLSATATGASLVPVTMMVSVEEELAPWSSVMV